jgi:hypothetical protein
MLERIAMSFKLSQSTRIKHDAASDNYYLFDVENGNHVRLNRASYSILKQLEKGMAPDEIAASLCKDYEVDWENSKKDISDLIHFLSKNGFIQS